ncbi:hypothetical protein GFL39_29340 [Rhizobium leguminosarum bv. viciae]|nr:hypothetical protein [Rhizobium leguminosarum bv. viciae]NKL08934.1 hypothetical protein [Rhizobium leguminosarum bv. viciae]NKL87632.1 hypothetical protein [Rhizobium leguminosarum bv. viciae]NKL94634.1 hypothetical protein [Rhizobium leguminosarum bv. viciae]NKM95109.1 hypothetical protein [Rhizobium leguminosarum bv. viciae]
MISTADMRAQSRLILRWPKRSALRAESGPTVFASEAQAILQGANWVDPVERRRAYNEQGWTRFDDTLDPYAPEQIAQHGADFGRSNPPLSSTLLASGEEG